MTAGRVDDQAGGARRNKTSGDSQQGLENSSLGDTSADQRGVDGAAEAQTGAEPAREGGSARRDGIGMSHGAPTPNRGDAQSARGNEQIGQGYQKRS